MAREILIIAVLIVTVTHGFGWLGTIICVGIYACWPDT